MNLKLTSMSVILLAWLAADVFAQGMFGGSRSVGGGTISGGSRNAIGAGGAGGGTPGTGLDQIGNTGQITGSERFVRDNRTTGQFVGSDSADTAFVGALQGATGGVGGSNFGGIGGFGGGAGGAFGGGRNAQGGRQQATGGFNQNSNRTINVRTKLEVGFEHTPVAQPTVQSNLQTRLNRVRLKRRSPIQVEIQGRTATLTGSVETESARALAVAIAKLEPGVETVVDQLFVENRDSQSR